MSLPNSYNVIVSPIFPKTKKITEKYKNHETYSNIMRDSKWTIDVPYLVSSFNNYKKTNVFHNYQHTFVEQTSENSCRIIFAAPSAVAIAEVSLIDPHTQTWGINAWFSPTVLSDMNTLLLALYAIQSTQSPHLHTTVSTDSSSTPNLYTYQQMQLGDEEYEPDWLQIGNEPDWLQAFTLIEDLIVGEYKKYFFFSARKQHPGLDISHFSMSFFPADNTFKMKLFALQESTTFIFTVSEIKIALNLGGLLGTKQSNKYSILYRKQDDTLHLPPPIRYAINKIVQGNSIDRECINDLLCYTIEQAQKMRTLNVPLYTRESDSSGVLFNM